jgi:hypothetical protein
MSKHIPCPLSRQCPLPKHCTNRCSRWALCVNPEPVCNPPATPSHKLPGELVATAWFLGLIGVPCMAFLGPLALVFLGMGSWLPGGVLALGFCVWAWLLMDVASACREWRQGR